MKIHYFRVIGVMGIVFSIGVILLWFNSIILGFLLTFVGGYGLLLWCSVESIEWERNHRPESPTPGASPPPAPAPAGFPSIATASAHWPILFFHQPATCLLRVAD